ncbi:MAG: hypothetical protein U9N35_03755 [Euryarchaeota archaeon]|nr:hypothetical protein [Euryarchaeota archaeon]
MKNAGKKITLKSCLNVFNDKDGYIKLTDDTLRSTLFFKDGELHLAFYRPIDEYSYSLGDDAVKNLDEGIFFDGLACFAGKKFVSEMVEQFPEASVSIEMPIRYPREDELDAKLDGAKRKEAVKKELFAFLESFVSENSEDLEYAIGNGMEMELSDHLNSVFPNVKIDRGVYELVNEILRTESKVDIKEEYESELSKHITAEADEELKKEMTSIVSDIATEYIKRIKEPMKSKKKVKNKSIQYFSGVINNHLKDAEDISPFERSIHLKKIVSRNPIGAMDPMIRKHVEILKELFIKKIDLIKRCHLCGRQIEAGFLCKNCEGEYGKYRMERQKLKNLIKKIEQFYIRGEINKEEYKHLVKSAREKTLILQETGKKFETLKEFVNL